MAFCKFSIDMLASNTTNVDNIFINNYLPYADANFVKVYLYGLYKCQDAGATDNTLENFAREINMDVKQVEEAFTFWQEQGLVQILNVIPFEVRFLPISDVINNTKKYNAKKYESFNAQAQEILCGRMITPNEYREYYDIIERFHVEKEALLMIIKYCASVKGDNVGYAYITTVAKDWANQKITTAKQVEERLVEFENLQSGVEYICKLIGMRKIPGIEERNLYKKWTDEGFDEQVLTFVAKKLKGKHFGVMDVVLDKYYSQKLFNVNDIELYEQEKKTLNSIARKIVKNLGLYYEDVEPVVEQYIFPWINMGFDENMLNEISNFCFKTNERTLERMDIILNKFQKLGVLSQESLAQYFNEVLSVDKKIKEILQSIGLSRNPNQYDREKYKVWKNVWNMPDDVIEYACTQALGKEQPMQYLSSILSNLHDKNIRTLEDTKHSFEIVKPKSQKANFSSGHSYTKEEMNSLFQSIEEIEI